MTAKTEKMSLNIDGEYDIRNINQKSFENEWKLVLENVDVVEMALEQST